MATKEKHDMVSLNASDGTTSDINEYFHARPLYYRNCVLNCQTESTYLKY